MGSAKQLEIGRYVVVGTLGHGGMGVVYDAYDPELARRVALKLVDPAASGMSRDSPAFTVVHEALVAEAKALASLAHPNIVGVFDVGTHGELVFLALERIDGEDLGDWIRARRREGPIDRRELVRCAIDIARALQYAHERGIVHRDVKPGNVLRSQEGRYVLSDFGLACDLDDDEDTTAGGLGEISGFDVHAPPTTRRHVAVSAETTLSGGSADRGSGTPAYMAPEQHRGEGVDARSDQFAFCALVYELLTGRRAFLEHELRELLAEKQRHRVVWPPESRRFSLRLRRGIESGLCPDPEARHPSMETLVQLLSAEAQRLAVPMWRRVGASTLAMGAMFSMALVTANGLTVEDRQCAGTLDADLPTRDPASRRRVRERFAASELDYAAQSAERVLRVLDDHARRWQSQRDEVCQAPPAKSGAQMSDFDLRVRCLERTREEARSLVGRLELADAQVIEHAVEAALKLTPVERCADLDALRQPWEFAPPQIADRVAHYERELEDFGWAQAMGTGQAQEEKFATLMAEVDALGHPPLIVDYHQAAADAAQTRLMIDSAIEHARIAMRHAITMGDRSRAAKAAGTLVFMEGYLRRDDAAATDFTRLAWSWAAGDEASVDTQLGLHSTTAPHDFARGDQASAEHKYRTAAALLEDAGPEKRLELAMMLNNLGYVIGQSPRRLREAIPLYRRSLKIYEETLGRDHPSNGLTITNLGIAEVHTGEYRAGLDNLDRGLEVLESAYGKGHPSTLHQLVSRAETRARLGLPRAAMEDYETAKSTHIAVHGMHGRRGNMIYLPMAVVAATLGDDEQARAHLDLARADPSVTPTQPSLRRALDARDRAMVHALGGRPEAARAELDFVRRTLIALDDEQSLLERDRLDTAPIWLVLGELERAATLAQRRIDHLEELFGSDNPQLARPQLVLAEVRRHQHRPADAIVLADAALALLAGALGSDHPAGARAWAHRGLARIEAGDREGLEDLQRARDQAAGQLSARLDREIAASLRTKRVRAAR